MRFQQQRGPDKLSIRACYDERYSVRAAVQYDAALAVPADFMYFTLVFVLNFGTDATVVHSV
jgi:hypothetical protein